MKRFGLSMKGSSSLVVGLAILTVFQFVYTSLIQRSRELGRFDLNSLTNFHVDVFDAGFLVQQLVVPVALLFVLSNLPFFKRIVNEKSLKHDSGLLFAFFVFIQLAFFAYSYSLSPDEIVPINIFFMVIATGFMGGVRMGLGMGALTFVLVAVRALVTFPPEDLAVNELLRVYFFEQDESVHLLWQGGVAGLLGNFLGRLRFLPIIAFTLGFCIEFVGRSLAAPAQPELWNWAGHTLIISLAGGITLALIALMVRNVQVGHVRQQAERAELAITQAELRALRAQMNPHFIFNSLNTIRYFVRTQPDKARDLLLSLSEIFQRSLKSGEFIPLREEIAYVEAYLTLEKARLDERLNIEWIMPDERVLDIHVPTLILQPVVENAVIHGIAKKTEGGKLSITLETWSNELVMQVRDDGLGFDSRDWRSHIKELTSEQDRPSIGLKNIDGRLRMLYGEDYRLTLESTEGVGTRVQIKIPMVQHLIPKAIEEQKPSSLPTNPKALEGVS